MSSAQRRIPQDSDESMQLFRGLTIQDGVMIMPGIFLLMLAIAFVPPVLLIQAIVVSVAIIVLGLTAVFTTPEHYNSMEWVSLHVGHALTPSEYDHLEYNYEHANRKQVDDVDHGFLKNAIATNQRTQDVLGITRVYPGPEDIPGGGAIETEDGTLIGAVRVYPANLTLATPREWRSAVENLSSLVNTYDHQMQLYYTTREFDAVEFLDPYKQRRNDQDILSEPVLELLLNEFNAWYPERLREHDTRISEFYIILGVRPDEVKSAARTEGLSDKLGDMPVISVFFGGDDGDDEIPGIVERGRQRSELYNRLEETSFKVKDISGVDAEIASAPDHAETLSKAWMRSPRTDDVEGQMKTNGVVTPEEGAEEEVTEA